MLVNRDESLLLWYAYFGESFADFNPSLPELRLMLGDLYSSI